MPQMNDYVASIQFLGAATAAPEGGIAAASIDTFFTDPNIPQGRMEIGTMCGLGGISPCNALRMVIEAGVSLTDRRDGSFNDHGHGTFTVPDDGGIYIGNTGAMTADNNGPGGTHRWVINSSSGLAFSAPALLSCSRGIKTDGQGNLSCL